MPLSQKIKHSKFLKKFQRITAENKSFVLFRKPNSSTVECWENKKIKASANKFICTSFDSCETIIFHDDEVTEIEVEKLPHFEIKLPESHEDESISYTDYIHLVEDTIKELKSDSPSKKIVISRVKELNHKKVDVLETFKNLHQKYSNAYVYLFYSEHNGCWIGASPELLLREENHLIKTISLAGTKEMKDSWSEKEYGEQQVVTDYIVSTLSKFSTEVNVDGPFSVDAGYFEHLKSFITAKIKDRSKLQQLLQTLHPTPAVGGIPKDLAINFIAKNEGYKRSFYTGFMGYQKDNESEYFVNLRCAKIFSNKVKLYVGGGIMHDSVPEKEWKETEIKSKTIGKLLVSKD